MEDLFKITEELAKKIEKMESERIRLAEVLRKISISSGIEEKTIFKVEKSNLESLKIAGVDGGIVKRSLHGMDLILLRAIGVIFFYSKGKLEKVEYYPEALPTPIPKIVFEPLHEIELEMNSNYERQIIETSTASEVIENFKPDIIFLDGSIIPHYTEKPAKDSILFPTYENLIQSYLNLFSKAREKNCVLAGVIEDSRGTRFCEIIKEKANLNPELIEFKPLLENSKDSNLLTYALKLNERTCVFNYSSEPEKHPILKEFGEFSNSIFSFYLKTAEFDRPIRVDFLGEKDCVKTANFISSVLLALSGHANYGMPSVLIEADQRAKLTEKDLELFYYDLLTKVGNLASLFSLRREQRPF
ncbi:MAG: DNA double-strand break repair nuclease NurA [Candidatus Aenigmatarchaeota archaeon]